MEQTLSVNMHESRGENFPHIESSAYLYVEVNISKFGLVKTNEIYCAF